MNVFIRASAFGVHEISISVKLAVSFGVFYIKAIRKIFYAVALDE